jgi:hypothetical protein
MHVTQQSQPDRWMPRILLLAGSAAALWLAVGIGPASAQFGGIFGGPPPRPPSNVPTRPPPQPQPGPDSGGFQSDLAPPIQSQPLPPPGGAPVNDPRLPQTAQPPAAVPANGPAPATGMQPGQRPLRGTISANATPQSDDDTVTELPSQKIANPTAIFAGLDKITGRITSFDVAVNETVQFGALRVTPRVCYTRPPTETPNTDAFIEVQEVTLQGEVKPIFSGWMFAASPGLHAVEHPIYDVWLTNCTGGASTVAAVQPATPAQPSAPRAQTKPSQPQAMRQTKPPTPAVTPPSYGVPPPTPR